MGIYAFWSVTNCLLGILIVAFILYRHNDLALRLLALGLFTLLYSSFVVYLWQTGYMLSFPHFFRTVPIVYYLAAPAFYLYVAFAIKKRSRLYWSDLIHLIPVILFVVDYLPFFLSSFGEKQELIKETIKNRSIYTFSEGWLFLDNVHAIARAVIALIYGATQVRMIFQAPKKSPADSVDPHGMFGWLLSLTFLEIIFSLSTFVAIVFYPEIVQSLSNESVTIIFVTVLLLLIFKPSILYGMRYSDMDSKKAIETPRPVNFLSEEVISELDERLKVFIQEKTYLKHDITLAELAEQLKTRPYILSAFLNRKYEMHFNVLINKLRIEYITEGLANDKWGILTLEAIGQQAGFNNRTTFFNSFKKFTGMTPTQYIKEMKNGNNKSAVISDDDM